MTLAIRRALHSRLSCCVARPAAAPRLFTTTQFICAKALPPRPKPPPDSDIEESYLKGSGPGGQKINKTNSAVQLKHIPTGIVVKSQGTRSRSQNRKIAREILAQKVDDALNGTTSRSAIVGEVKRKKAASASKKSRRKYRKLEEQAEGDAGAGKDETYLGGTIDRPDGSTEAATPEAQDHEPNTSPETVAQDQRQRSNNDQKSL
ncbi:hypothetical protein CC79DRAFT_1333287 [Sarocladium strictum]